MHTGALAQQMEEQLMHEFEALLASRRKEGLAASSSSHSHASRKVRGGQKENGSID